VAATFVKVTKCPNGAATVTATAGNTLVMVASGYYSGTVAAPTFGVSGGGTWAALGSDNQHLAPTDNFVCGFAVCQSATGGALTITATFGSPVAANTSFAYEFSGVPSAVVDILGTGTQGATSPISSTSLTNIAAAAVFLAVGATLSTGTETHATTGSGWTMPAGGDETNGATSVTAVTAYQIVAAAAAQTETWTDSPSVPWTSFIVAIKSGVSIEPGHLMLAGVT
jgi:hypothetical protein